MSSAAPTADAQTLTRSLGEMLTPPGSNWKRQVSAVHAALVDERCPVRLERLTWSRVKTWFYGENRRTDHAEMDALRELHALKEAQRAHRDFVASTNRMAADLAAEGAPLSRRQMEALGRIAERATAVRGDHGARALSSSGGAYGAGAFL